MKTTTIQLIMPVRNDRQSKKKASEAKKYYTSRGFEVMTPHDIADIIVEETGIYDEGKIQAACMYWLNKVDLAVLLPGWEHSEGCINEIAFATRNNVPIYFYKSNIQVHFNTNTSVNIDSHRLGDIIDEKVITQGA